MAQTVRLPYALSFKYSNRNSEILFSALLTTGYKNVLGVAVYHLRTVSYIHGAATPALLSADQAAYTEFMSYFPISDTDKAALGQIDDYQKRTKRGYFEARNIYRDQTKLGYHPVE